MESCFKSEMEKQLASKYCEAIKKQATALELNADSIKLECKLPQYEFVVQNDGINIATWSHKAREVRLDSAIVGQADLAQYFKAGCLPE